MKAEITGYVTALINIYGKRVNFNTNTKVLSDLRDLLEFVEDIPEQTNELSEPITVYFNRNDEEVAKLKSVIRELEDSCENMNEVEKNLHGKIELLMKDNKMWQKTCNELRDKNNILEEKLSARGVLEGSK